MPGFEYSGWMTLITAATMAVCGQLELALTTDGRRVGTLVQYLKLSLLTLGGMYFTNWSLKYLNYPTRVLFKSSKLLPTMVVSCKNVSRVCESPSSSTRRPRRHAAASSRRNCRKPGVPASSGRHCAANFCRASALSLIALAPTGARLPLGPGMNQKHWPGRTLSPEALAAHRCSSAPEQ